MSAVEQSEPTPGGMIAYPLLIECDSRGRVIWMSERTRSSLCQTLNVPYIEPSELDGEPDLRRHPVPNFQFRRVLEMGDRVLISIQSPEPAASMALHEVSEMLRMESRMLRHYFRLQVAERIIAGHARKKRGSGTKALQLVEMERRRIARELHTGVGQVLAAISLQLEVVGKHDPDPPAPIGQALKQIRTLTTDALEEVRSVAQRLHPPEWQRLSLPAALRQLWVGSGVPLKFEGSLQIGDVPAEPDLQVKVLIYRAAQEAISNLVRHSRASRVDAALELEGDRLVLRIEDNGVGFDVTALDLAPANVASGIGLRSIRELAADLGGNLAVDSGPAGTKLVVYVPCKPVAA